MTQVRLISTLQADDVKAALRGLAPKVQERVVKKGMRRGMKPMQEALRQAWRSANYRGKDTHRRAIAAATLTDARRSGRGTEIVGKVGVMYGRKGGATAKGRQRIWHLLEGGFRRFNQGSAYANFSKGSQSDRAGYRKFVTENRKSIMAEGLPKQMRSDALRAMYADARTKFSIYVSERETRKESRSKSQIAMMLGSYRSKMVVRFMLFATMRKVRDEVLEAARAALLGGGRGNR